MKEYVAEAGGRYTYVDDILNLQELTLSMTSIFTDCANFIISGCEVVSDNEITSGYVWINKKIRYFEGGKGIKFPYYLVENNTVDSVMYAKEAVKGGEIIICALEVRQSRPNPALQMLFSSLRLLPHTHPDL